MRKRIGVLGVFCLFLGFAVPAVAHAAVVSETLTIWNGSFRGKPGPYYSPATWTWPEGRLMRLTIISHDDGVSPLSPGSVDARVQGTRGLVEWVNGARVTAIPPAAISHTLTISALHVNLPIPAAQKGGTVAVVAFLRLTKSGTFTWECVAPCGTGPQGDLGPMAEPGYMQGTVHVQPVLTAR